MSDAISKTTTRAKLRVTMPDGSRWDVPVQVIADDRDDYYSDDNEDTIRSIREGGLDASDITDWAANNMNWSHVEKHAVKIENPPKPDYEDGWCNGDKEIVGKI
jgi:hypothetical protein